VPNCKSSLVTETARKHVRRRARFQQHRDASCHQVFFPLQGKAPKEIHAILTETLRENAPSYATVKNWVDQFKHGDFSTCDPGRLKTVTTSEIIDAEVIAAAKTWLDGQLSEFFFSGLRNLGQRAKKCTELRGEYVE